MGRGKKAGTKIELTDEEVELLVRVLMKHRNTLPSYLLSMRDEVRILTALLDKLS